MDSPQLDQRIHKLTEVMRLSEQTRVECMAWAFEHLKAAAFWENEYRHHARELHVTLIQKWKGGGDESSIRPR